MYAVDKAHQRLLNMFKIRVNNSEMTIDVTMGKKKVKLPFLITMSPGNLPTISSTRPKSIKAMPPMMITVPKLRHSFIRIFIIQVADYGDGS